MLKVAVVGSRNLPANYGGVETACENLYTGLAERGLRIVTYCRSDGWKIQRTRHKGVNVVNFPAPEIPGIGTFLHCFIATVLAIFSDADIIHFHAQGPSLFSFIPRLFSPGKKVGFTCQGRDWQRDRWGRIARAVIRLGERHSAKYTDFRIMVSNDLRNYYQTVYGVDSVCIPNGVNIPQTAELKSLAEKFGLRKDGYLLFIGRLVPEKAPDILIRAFNGITTDVKLVIAGDSPETPDYVNYLKDLAKDNPNIIFTSYIRGREIAEAYSNALAYVSPSRLEGNPITALEAMSYSLPLLVSDIPPHQEILSFYQNPIASFRTNSVDACREGLQNLIQLSQDRLKGVGRESYSVVKRHFAWDHIADETLALYRRVTTKQTPTFTKQVSLSQ